MVMLIIGCFTATEEGDFTMKILGFVHAGVVVEDINKAIEFYNGVLGLEVLDGPGEWVTDFNETRAMGLGDVLHRIAHLKCADGSQVELIEFENSRDLEGSDMSDYNGKEHMLKSLRNTDFILLPHQWAGKHLMPQAERLTG